MSIAVVMNSIETRSPTTQDNSCMCGNVEHREFVLNGTELDY